MAEIKAIARFSRISASKANLVADLIRKKPAQKALWILKYTPRAGSKIILRVLQSAIANASENADIKDPDKLWVEQVITNQGITLKRFKSAARGRATRIRKRTSHITIILKEIESEKLSDKK